jgi:hypothetical protein
MARFGTATDARTTATSAPKDLESLKEKKA